MSHDWHLSSSKHSDWNLQAWTRRQHGHHFLIDLGSGEPVPLIERLLKSFVTQQGPSVGFCFFQCCALVSQMREELPFVNAKLGADQPCRRDRGTFQVRDQRDLGEAIALGVGRTHLKGHYIALSEMLRGKVELPALPREPAEHPVGVSVSISFA